MPFKCGDHTHETVQEARDAHGVGPDRTAVSGPVTAPAPAVVPQPAPAPAAPYAAARDLWEPLTDRQRDYAKTLGLDLNACALLGKRGTSQLIDVTRGFKPLQVAIENLHGAGARRIAAPPAPVAPAYVEPPRRSEPSPIPVEMVNLIKSGYYGAQANDRSPFVFFKVTRPTSGNFKNTTKVMTRHGDDWKLAWVLWPSGKASSYRDDIVDLILEVIPNQDKAGLIYAQEIGSCCICGKALTDERSRYYGIGPDCETRHLYKIEYVEAEFGPYAPGKGFSRIADRD